MNDYHLTKGYVQVYTGDGKGKTTAALGLAIRAAGHGLRSYIGQFMKGQHYGELDARVLAPAARDELAGHAARLRTYWWPRASVVSKPAAPGPDGDASYQITYSQVTEKEYACWVIHLDDMLDISDRSRLSFDIKGEQGGEIAHVWLESPCATGEQRNVAVFDTSKGLHYPERVKVPVTKEWERIVIPLDSFYVIPSDDEVDDPSEWVRTLEPSCIQEVSICFEWRDMEGTIYVDGFAFE